MFGFFSKPVCEIITEANGYVNTTNRDFFIGHGTFNTVAAIPRYFFDYDDVGSNADQQALTAITFITYNGNPKATMSFSTLIPLSNGVIGGTSNLSIYLTIYQNTGVRNKFRYTTNAALTPPTRKIRQELSYYYTNTLAFIYDQNTTPTSASNNLRNDLVVNGAKFPELAGFFVHETFLSGITFNLQSNSKCTVFQIRECAQLTSLIGTVPSTIKSFSFCANSLITNINSLISGATGIEGFALGLYSGTMNLAVPQTTLIGTLELAHMVNMKEIYLPTNSSLTAVNIPTGKTDWSWVHIQGLSAAASTAFSTTRLDEFLTSPDLRAFVFISNGKTYSRNITNSDISDDLLVFYNYGNSWTGNISLTSPHPTLKEFKTGNNGTHVGLQLNDHQIVNITGLTQAVLKVIDLSGCLVQDLELPINTGITTMVLMDNELDIVTNPNLITQINAMTSLTVLRFSPNTTSALEINHVGQDSINGLGNNVNISSLINLTEFIIASCKLTGSLTLPNVNKLTVLNVSFNTGLTSIVNLTAHTSIVGIVAHGCTSLSFSINNSFTVISNIRGDNSLISSIDLSGKVSTTQLQIIIRNANVLTTITFPTTQANAVVQVGTTFQIENCTGLTSLTNVENLNWVTTTGLITNSFFMSGNALNITFPFGLNNFIPNSITIQNNGMSQVNVDATINSMYTGRTKWNGYTSAKSLNISGTNSTPSGTYQAPAGFVLDSSDGTPASALEQVYVLVNNYDWSITYT